MIENIISLLKDMLPAVFTVVFFVILYFALKSILDKQSKGKTEWSFIRLLILLTIGLTGLIAFLLALPIAESVRNQIINLLGIVISAALALSSATLFGNALAGIMLKAIKNFNTGDFIEVNGIMGRVTERGLFHTEVQTEDRDLTTLPNMLIANNPVKVIRSSGTFISAEVSLGYDVNRQLIERALLRAATKANLNDAFVLITTLGDFSVVYRLNGLLKNTKTIISARSELYAQILDALHEDDIEIVSPNFMNQRQVGDQIFIPKKVEGVIKETNDKKPEEIMFDKADQAETIDELKRLIQDLNGKISTCQSDIKSSSDDVERAKLEDKLSRFKKLKEKLTIKLDSKDDSIGD